MEANKLLKLGDFLYKWGNLSHDNPAQSQLQLGWSQICKIGCNPPLPQAEFCAPLKASRE